MIVNGGKLPNETYYDKFLGSEWVKISDRRFNWGDTLDVPVYFSGLKSDFDEAKYYGHLFKQNWSFRDQYYVIFDNYYRPINQANEYVYDLDPATTAPLTCDGGEEGDDVAVWQFVQGTQDLENKLFGFAICRYGGISGEAPEVPYSACLNADCSDYESNWGYEVIIE